MKYFALLLTILICAAPLFAQTPAPQPDVVPTPYGETPEAWQNFAPAEEQFSLEVPGAVTSNVEENPPASTAGSGALPSAELRKSRRYLTLVGGDYYYIFSDSVDSPDLNKWIYSFAEAQAPGIDPNQIYAFEDEFGFYHKILIVKSGDRVYTFQTVSQTKDSQSAKRFFDGIRIKGMKLQADEIEALQNTPTEDSRRVISCNPPLIPPPAAPTPKPAENKTGSISSGSTGTGASGGNGRGTDGGISTGIGSINGISSETPVTPLPAPAQTNAIKIISKPRPSYTDLARFYSTTGMVALRVTFLANGKIGSISTVRRLPFGLTEQAIAAACSVQFEPATKNGTAYSVTRQVQYNFTLY